MAGPLGWAVYGPDALDTQIENGIMRYQRKYNDLPETVIINPGMKEMLGVSNGTLKTDKCTLDVVVNEKIRTSDVFFCSDPEEFKAKRTINGSWKK